MNVNPRAKVVLCYGDSNTRGNRPELDSSERYTADKRWTGRLQAKLGEAYNIVEEGLGGRTTDLDDPRPEKPGRNGLTCLVPCIQSHHPFDVVIIILGTNDFKNVHDRTAAQTAEVLGDYCDVIREYTYGRDVKIVLVSPTEIVPVDPVVYYDASSAQKSRELPVELQKVANAKNAYFFDAATVAKVGEDGLHWDEVSLQRFAESMEKIVRELV